MKLPIKTLCLSIAIVNMQVASALESLDDDTMSGVTGEGIAFLPENFAMVMRGTNTATLDATSGLYLENINNILTDRTKDTGYIRYIPVGALTPAASAAGAGKGDIFLYGLALSRADGNSNSRLSSTDPLITAWGTSDNPWLYKVQTENSVPTFGATGTGDVTYLAFEAPLYHQTLPTTRATGSDAYNLKLALWADAFVRDPNVVENMAATGTQFDVGGAGRANRLRLQGVWDGFSINGSEIKVFQTLNGAVTGTNGMDNFYNNTLGLTGVLRFNSGATNNLRATHTYTAGSRTIESYTVTWNGATFNGSANYTNTSGVSGGSASPTCINTPTHNAAGSSCRIRYQTRATIDSASSSTWTPPATSVLRFSTQECGTGNPNGCTTPVAQGVLETSAINDGTPAPTFAPQEGLHLYSPNFNLVYGQLYQPLIVGVATDNKNLVLEVARIANRQDVYTKIYTRYPGDTGDTGITYSGSTCNVHQCGDAVTLGGTTYQGKTATHSSISIGSTNYDSTNNLLTADSSIGAFGVSFGALVANSYSTVAQSYRDVQSSTRTNATTTTWTAYANLPIGSSALFNLATYSPNTWTQQAALPTPAFAQPESSIPLNNLGSAVIDGLLVQHLKITTKGL